VVQLTHDALDADTTHTHTGADGVNPFLQSHNGDLGAGAGLARNALDVNLPVVNLGHFQLQQPAQQVAMVTAHHNLRPAVGAPHLQQVDADLVMRLIAFRTDLLAARHDRFRAPQPNGDVLATHALDRAVDNLAFAF